MRKKYAAGIFGSLLEAVALAGLIAHFFVVLVVWGFLSEPFSVTVAHTGAGDNYGGQSDVLLLFCISAAVYAGLTWIGRFPDKFNYPWKINDDNAGVQYHLAGNFLKQIKIELIWLFALIALRSVGAVVEEFGELINFSIFLLILVISATVVGYLAVASRSSNTKINRE